MSGISSSDQELDVVLSLIAEFRGHDVGAEEGRDDTGGSFLAQPVIDPEQPEFGLDVEAIAALAFDRGDAQRHHPFEEAASPIEQCVLGHRAGLGNGGHDAAAPARDIEVTAPLNSLLELLGPPAAEGEVGMAVDQTGNDQGTISVPALPGGVVGRQGLFRSDPQQGSTFPDQSGVLDGMDI
jgi:hypothetical protein